MMNDYEDRRNDYGGYGEQPMGAPQFNNFSGVAKIKVIGVGGAGNNAVNRLIESGLKSAEYIVVNTDNQALARSKASNRIQIGVKLTKGLGAGADPTVGKAAAEENKEAIQEALKDTDLLFITAGMGGGTGTGAAPVVARLAHEMGILTVGIVTKPFSFEGKRRFEQAEQGIAELRQYVDSLVVVPNEKLKQVSDTRITLGNAFEIADDVLQQAVQSISDLIKNTGFINLDFADVTAVMENAGRAHMGVGRAAGKSKAEEAARMAISSPLLETSINGATGVLVNVTGSSEMTLDDVEIAAGIVQEAASPEANIIFGATVCDDFEDELRVTVIATGFDSKAQAGFPAKEEKVAAPEAAPAQAAKPADVADIDEIFKIFNR